MSKNETKYFLIGLFFLITGLFCITFLSPILKHFNFSIEPYVIVELEFFLMLGASMFFFLSPSYLQVQIYSILAGLFYYITFVQFYPLLAP